MSVLEAISRKVQESKRQKRLLSAQHWPTMNGTVNHWAVVPADGGVSGSATPYQIEASFSFVLNGEYYGGYLRSVGLTHHQAETLAKGEPEVVVRYDPANADVTAVLAEDNVGRLPFEVVSG